MHTLHLELDIAFLSRWHTGSGEAGSAAQRLVRRDARGWPYVPASTLKGVIRHQCEKLCRTLGFPEPCDPHQPDLSQKGRFVPLATDLSPVETLFGNNFQEGGLFFADARLSAPPYREQWLATRTQMYRLLRTVKAKHLFTTEYIRPLTLHAAIIGRHAQLAVFEAGDIPFASCLLVAAILQVERLGGDKSCGSSHVRIRLASPIRYNGREIPLDQIFDYFDPEIIAASYGSGVMPP